MIIRMLYVAWRNFMTQNNNELSIINERIMNLETSSMDFETKDEIIHKMLAKDQELIENSNSESESQLRIKAKNLFCPSPPSTFPLEINTVHTDDEFDENIRKRLRMNSISKALVICPNCPMTFPTSKALEKHTLNNQHAAAEGDKRERMTFTCVTCAARNFIDQTSLDEHLKQCHVTNTVTVSLSRPRVISVFEIDPLKIIPSSATATTPSGRSKKKLKVTHVSKTQDKTCRPKSLLKCPHCDKNFSQKRLLVNHISRMHSGPRTRINCPQCQFTCLDPRSFKKHVIKFHKEQHESSDNREGQTILEPSHHTDNGNGQETEAQKLITNSAINCRYCSELFFNASSLKEHIVQIHIKQKKTVNIKKNSPAKILVTKVDEVQHKKTGAATSPGKNKSQSRIQCHQCPSTFSNRKHLEFHIILQHVEKNKFPCLICATRNRDQTSRDPGSDAATELAFKRGTNFIFKDKRSLKQHMENMHFCTHLNKRNGNLQKEQHPTDQQIPHKIIIPTSENKICPICSKTFNGKWSASGYRDHMRAHLGLSRFSCEHCSQKFKKLTPLHAHLIRCHTYTSEQLNFKLKCHLCNFVGRNQLRLNYHVGRKHSGRSNINNIANSNGNSKECIETNSTKSAVCFVCSQIQPSRCELIQHLKEHRGDGRFFCDLCPRDYSMRMALMTHLKQNHHKLAYCNKCFTSFNDATQLNQHLLHVEVLTPTSNQGLGSLTLTLENDNSPMRSTSNLKCKICNESSKSACLFKIHTISHLKERQQKKWRLPEEVVSAEKIFKCPVCPTATAFDRQSYLSAHLEIVHKSPPDPDSSSRFNCKKCEREYKFVSELKLHDLVVHSPKINQHVNQNRDSNNSVSGLGFKCDICSAYFSTHSELTNHQDQFSSEVLCHICPAKFYCKAYLQLHIQKCHQDKATKAQKFLCHMCPSKFSRGQELWGHEARVHGAKSRSRKKKKKKAT